MFSEEMLWLYAWYSVNKSDIEKVKRGSMALKKKAVTGMKDILPREMAVRQRVLSTIRKVYGGFGFTEIETPIVEHLSNLLSKQGGDNEKLIFKVEKRGEKLKEALEKGDFENLSDSGLRYDLTLPLSRFYAENQGDLPTPFKALQIGPVFRADRPQKGRFREFWQCDIDIFGDASYLSEIDLLLAMGTVLQEIGFGEKYPFYIVLNDRAILKAMQSYAGFPEEDFSDISIVLDKEDKIGREGVREELLSLSYTEEQISRYEDCLNLVKGDKEDILKLQEKLGAHLDDEVGKNLYRIMKMVEESGKGTIPLRFDPTLVRGMGYYTGPIFEVRSTLFSGSIGGGGRYDKMVGKFIGVDTPAVGFSIGFERIIGILLEGEEEVHSEGKIAYLVDKKVSEEKLSACLTEVMEKRERGEVVLLTQMNKNKKFQKEKLSAEGYKEFVEIYGD